MASIVQIAKLAGFLEGEGCFDLVDNGSGRKYPRIQFNTTDRDVAEWAASVLDAPKLHEVLPRKQDMGTKLQFRAYVSGTKAVQWMLTLFVLMGSRRKARIRGCLDAWRNQPAAYQKRIKP